MGYCFIESLVQECLLSNPWSPVHIAEHLAIFFDLPFIYFSRYILILSLYFFARPGFLKANCIK